MGVARYCPRDFCDYPAEFGHSDRLKFAPPPSLLIENPTTPADRARVLDNRTFAIHASWQNEYSIVIRSFLKVEHLTLAAYGELLGRSGSSVGAKLRGTSVMTELDVERANIVFRGSVRRLVKINRRRKRNDELAAALREIEYEARFSPPWPAWDASPEEH